jgi:hypothetical protein
LTCHFPKQHFGLNDDVQKFSSELARIERMAAAAAGAPTAAAEALRPGTALTRLTAQRPGTSLGRPQGAAPGVPLPPATRGLPK